MSFLLSYLDFSNTVSCTDKHNKLWKKKLTLFLQQWWSKQNISAVKLVPAPDYKQNTLLQASDDFDFYIISRHAGRRANSIFSFPANQMGKFAVNFKGITMENEWKNDIHHIIPAIGTSPSDSGKTAGVVNVWVKPQNVNDLLPLTVGGVEQVIAFFQFLRHHNFLPSNNYVFTHSSLVERTIQTASLFWQIIMKCKGPKFTVDNSFTSPLQPFEIVTTSAFLTGDKFFGGTAIKQSFYGTPPPLPSPQAFHSFEGVNASDAGNFRKQNYDCGQSTNFVGGTVPNYEPQVMQILNKLLVVTGFNRDDLQSSLQQIVLWIIMQYIDQGPWVNTSNLTVKEWILLNNFYFSNIYSYGSALWAGNFVANILSDLNKWIQRDGLYTQGGNVAILAHENHIQALATAIGYVHNFHNNMRAFPPACMLVFKRNKMSNEVTAYSIAPNPVSCNDNNTFPPDTCFHSLLSGGIALNHAIQLASMKYPPA